MTFRSSTNRRQALSAFSLVEVIMALGIISFCLVALTGLLAMCLDQSRESSTATADTLLFEKVVNQLRVVTVDRNFEQIGDRDEDRFSLPMLGEEGETKFTVDSQNRFLAMGWRKTADAAKVVTVKVMNPSQFPTVGSDVPKALSEKGSLAFVQVTISNANAPENSTARSSSVYVTELSLLTE